jgi:CO dehydrogenase nickel-insertion accessory protein CooC1
MKEEYFLLKKIFEESPVKFFAVKINKNMNIEDHIGIDKENLPLDGIKDIIEKNFQCASSIDKATLEEDKIRIQIDNKIFDCTSKPLISEDGLIKSIVLIGWSK